MTQIRYKQPLNSFDLNVIPEKIYNVDILSQGKQALIEANNKLGVSYIVWHKVIIIKIECIFFYVVLKSLEKLYLLFTYS